MMTATAGAQTGFPGSVTETRARQGAPDWYTTHAVAGLCVMADADETLIPQWTGADRGRAKRTSSPFSRPGRITAAPVSVRPGNYGAIPIRFLHACQRQALTASRNGTVGPQRVIPIAQGPGSAL